MIDQSLIEKFEAMMLSPNCLPQYIAGLSKGVDIIRQHQQVSAAPLESRDNNATVNGESIGYNKDGRAVPLNIGDASTRKDEANTATVPLPAIAREPASSSPELPSEISDVTVSNLLHKLNLDRHDIAELPEGASIVCNITTLRQIGAYLRTTEPVSSEVRTMAWYILGRTPDKNTQTPHEIEETEESVWKIASKYAD